jgi:RND family efflux transporter MFP subunit
LVRKVIIVFAGVALAASIAWFGRAAVLGPPEHLPTETARATRRAVKSVIRATGVVRAALDAEVRVGVQSPGVLRRLHVRVGDQVKKGQLLAELESRSLRAKHGQALASVQSSEADLRFETAELARKQQLVAEQALAPRELEVGERNFALATAALAEARSNVAFSRALLEETRITAPISGVVAAVTTREGETVASGVSAPTLLTLIDLKRLETWAYVDETDIGRVSLGQQARFTVDSYPEREVEGKVTAIYPKPEIRDNVVDYIVIVGFVAPNDVTLRPEMTANVKIALEQRIGALTVPRRSVRREQGSAFVFTATSDVPTRHPVKTGAQDDNYTEIIEGLNEGAQVIVGELPSESAVTQE